MMESPAIPFNAWGVSEAIPKLTRRFKETDKRKLLDKALELSWDTNGDLVENVR